MAIYTKNKYVSADIDLVDVSYVNRKKLIAAMEEIGFHEKNRYFIHPDTSQVVEFPPGPLSIGEEPVRQIDEIQLSTGKLRLVSATDCVKDRLAAFYFWKDQQSLFQAVLVAKDNPVDMNEIRRWSKTTDNLREYKIFQKQVSNRAQK